MCIDESEKPNLRMSEPGIQENTSSTNAMSPSRDASSINSNDSFVVELGVTARERTLDEVKSITYWQGVSLVIVKQIGAAIFSVPALVNGNAGSLALSLTLWIICGLVAYAGACTSLDFASNISVLCRTRMCSPSQWRRIHVFTSALRSSLWMFIHMDHNISLTSGNYGVRCTHIRRLFCTRAIWNISNKRNQSHLGSQSPCAHERLARY